MVLIEFRDFIVEEIRRCDNFISVDEIEKARCDERILMHKSFKKFLQTLLEKYDVDVAYRNSPDSPLPFLQKVRLNVNEKMSKEPRT